MSDGNENKVLDIKDRLFFNKIIREINEIINDPEFKARVDEEFRRMNKKEKLGVILSDFGPHPKLPNILNSLGYTPNRLLEEYGVGEEGLRRIGFTPKKLRELKYDPQKYYKNLGLID